MDRQAVAGWLQRYVDAWISNDARAIGELFAAGADYRYHPFDQGDAVVHGREAIVRAWLEGVPEGVASSLDEPGTFEAHYEPYAVEGDRAVSAGWTRYWTDSTRRDETDTFDNVFLLRFDDDGRCREFTEYFVRRTKRAPPDPGPAGSG